MDLFKFIGCSELKFRYICLSVLLVYSLVYSLSSVMYISDWGVAGMLWSRGDRSHFCLVLHKKI